MLAAGMGKRLGQRLDSSCKQIVNLTLILFSLYQDKYSINFFLKCSIDPNSCKYKSSDFNRPKKFSITELSRQLPFQNMLCRIPFSSVSVNSSLVNKFY